MYQETRLANGLLVATEKMDAVETVSVGVFVHAGSRAETAKNNGVAHMLEHMAFKGTKRRSALQIATEVEDVGAFINAGTGRETTSYYLKLLKDDLPLGVDILADILQHSALPDEELERERKVILQELAQAKDTPDDWVFENFQQAAFPAQPMGRSILGTEETVASMTKEDLRAFMGTHYAGQNMVLAAAGNVDHTTLVKLSEDAFGGLQKTPAKPLTAAHYEGGEVMDRRQIEQVHVVMGFEGISYTDDDYFAAHVWTTLLGGGMASQLFQEIRENRGLVYSIFSFLSANYDTGTFGIYAATGKESVAELLPATLDLLWQSSAQIDDKSLERARNQLKAGMMMSLESTDTRMSRIAQDLFVHGRYVSTQEVLDKLNALTKEDLVRAATRLLDAQRPTLSMLGPMDVEAAQSHWQKALKGASAA